jgi:hypothetical protein
MSARDEGKRWARAVQIGAVAWLLAAGALALGVPRPERGWWASVYTDPDLRSLVDEQIDVYGPFRDWGVGGPVDGADVFAVRWEACWRLSEGRTLLLELTSDDGSRLFVDGELVIDNWGRHGIEAKGARVDLAPGVHRLRVDYFDGGGPGLVRLAPQDKSEPLPVDELTPLRPNSDCAREE